jgi:NitT/TauT family transport system ATP-binding protein
MRHRPVIEAAGLGRSYRQKGSGKPVTAIEDLSFEVQQGETIAVVGRTGCGKSTFFRLLLGLEAPSRGTLKINGRSPHADFDSFKGEIGVVFQEDRLLPWRSVMKNVCIGLEILGVPEEEQRRRAEGWLEKLGLSNYLEAYPNELSGGMRQRVAMARAFVVEPTVLLADEAFGHLDEVTARDLRKEFVQLVADIGATTMFITHDLSEALEMGDRVLVFGTPARVLADLRPKESNEPGMRERIQEMINGNVHAAA